MTATQSAGGVAALLSPFRLGTLILRNRVAVASMTRVSATAGGLATGRMAEYYRAFAEGGFGLVITEGIYTDKGFAQGYLHQPGLADDAQEAAWRRVVAEVHAGGSKIVAQLMHAGALSQGNMHLAGTVGPSAVLPKGVQIGELPRLRPVPDTGRDRPRRYRRGRRRLRGRGGPGARCQV